MLLLRVLLRAQRVKHRERYSKLRRGHFKLVSNLLFQTCCWCGEGLESPAGATLETVEHGAPASTALTNGWI